MEKKPFDKVWGWATITIVIAGIGLLAGIFCKILLLAIPESWTFWYGLSNLLYLICFWAFLIGVPLFGILCVVAFLGNLIWSLSRK